MTISVADLRWYQSERMTDEDDGGGQMTGIEIVPGVANAIFDDLSDVDRAAGDVSVRKIYGGAFSDGPDKYLDAGAAVFASPTDPAVSVLIFSTADFYDERAAMRERLESGITRGALWQGYLWGQHTAGQRAVTLWQRLSAPLPAIGRRIDLAAWLGSSITHNQILWITNVVQSLIERQDTGGIYQVRSVTLELAEALRDDYTGSEPTRIDPVAPATLVYDTRYNPEAINLVGIKPLVAQAALGGYAVRVPSLYAPLIPTALAETAMPDTNPGGVTAALVPAHSQTISFTTTADAIKPGVNLFLGSSCFPGTLAIHVSGATITDSGGILFLSTVPIGSIDYSNGVCTWTWAAPSYGTAAKTVSYRPAAVPLRVADTASQGVTVENRGYVWVITLTPIPAPGSLRIAYRANDAWYTLADGGSGTLAGTDSSYGSATLNFATGTVTLTTGVIPDVGSEILYSWSTSVSYTTRGGNAVDAPLLGGKVGHADLDPGSFEITWTVGSTEYSVTDAAADGLLVGDGTGAVLYSTGAWTVCPTLVPPLGTVFHVAYGWRTSVTESFDGPLRNEQGKVPIELADEPVAGTLQLLWDVVMTSPADQWGLETEFTPIPVQPTFVPPPLVVAEDPVPVPGYAAVVNPQVNLEKTESSSLRTCFSSG
jgi:hypothetical protein